MDSKLIVRARLYSSIRNSGPVSFAISIDASTTVRAVKELLLQKAQKAPGAPEWNAPSSPSAFIMRLNDAVPLVNEDVLVMTLFSLRLRILPSLRPPLPPNNCVLLYHLTIFVRLQMSAVMLYPEMRKISAQEEEEEVDSVEESPGSSGDAVRTKSSEKKLMTQIPLTILPCSSATSLYADLLIAPCCALC